METRKVMDCRSFPSEKDCTLTIAGREDEVMDASIDHAVKVHGEEDTPEFRAELQKLLEDEVPAVT